MHAVVDNCDNRITKALIAKGANINIKDNNNWTALMKVCDGGYY